MGEVEISINAEGALKVAKLHDLRVCVSRLRPEGFERHHVVKWLNSGDASEHVSEEEFVWVLKFFFLVILTLTLIYLIIIEKFFTYKDFPNYMPNMDQV